MGTVIIELVIILACGFLYGGGALLYSASKANEIGDSKSDEYDIETRTTVMSMKDGHQIFLPFDSIY